MLAEMVIDSMDHDTHIMALISQWTSDVTFDGQISADQLFVIFVIFSTNRRDDPTRIFLDRILQINCLAPFVNKACSWFIN